MPRERKGIQRKSGGQSRDPYVIFVIAAEGAVTEMQYFNMVKNKVMHCGLERLVKIEPIGREAGKSGFVTDVIETLDAYRKKYTLKEGDELWCVVDRDKTGSKNLAEAARQCKKKGYEFCMTSPCFEYWLLLHFKHPRQFEERALALLLENRKDKQLSYIEKCLTEALHEQKLKKYDKIRLDPVFETLLSVPVKTAFELQLEAAHWHPEKFCTRLHELIQRIFKLQAPDYLLPG